MNYLVYRNLRKGNWSIMSRATQHVVAHSDELVLWDVCPIVSEKGRQRVLMESRKNVHAFIAGNVCNGQDNQIMPYKGRAVVTVSSTAPVGIADDEWETVTYNPYRCGYFYSPTHNARLKTASYAKFTHAGKVLVNSAEWAD